MSNGSRVSRVSTKSTNDRFCQWAPWALALLILLAAPAFADSSLAQDQRVADALTVAPELSSFAKASVSDRGADAKRLRQLHEVLLVHGVSEASGVESAFQFVGLAREIGIDAYFVAVDAFSAPRGDQLAAGIGHNGRVVVFDPEIVHRPAHRRLQLLDDRAATALLYAATGRALLHAGDTTGAVERLEVAVDLDPELALAWSDLGVALRREGERERAMDAYERSLDLTIVSARLDSSTK